MAEKVSWPAWRYGPNGEAKIFNKDDIIPKGWTDSPKKVKPSVKKDAAPQPEPSQEEKSATIASIREAGVAISDDASVDEINAAIDKLTAKQGS